MSYRRLHSQSSAPNVELLDTSQESKKENNNQQKEQQEEEENMKIPDFTERYKAAFVLAGNQGIPNADLHIYIHIFLSTFFL